MKYHLLKKTLIAFSASVAIISMPQAANVPNFAAMDYVPADTAFFSGSLKAFPVKEYLELNKDLISAAIADNLDANDELATVKLWNGLGKEYLVNFAKPEQFMEAFGLANETRMLFYLVDFNPVFKVEVSDGDAFLAAMMSIQKKNGITGEDYEINGIKYQSYLLNKGEKNLIELIVSTHDGWATVTMASPSGENEHLKVALGSTKPAKALNQTKILQDMTDKYKFDGTQLGYIDHRILVDRITANKPIAFIPENDWKEMAEFQTPACRAEFADIAQAWPRTVVGTSTFSITSEEYIANSLSIIESNNKATNDALMDLRGFIPAHVGGAGEQMYSMALGLNVNKAPAALTKLWTAATSAKYECAPLLEMQQSLMQANPASLTMFAGMAQGVMGLSSIVYDVDVDMSKKQPQFKALDALFSLASENPAAQLQTASMMLPMLAGLNLPNDGTPVALNDILPQVNMVGGKTFAAISAKHLNVFKGDEAAKDSAALKKVSIDANGFFEIYLHYGKLFSALLNANIEDDTATIEQYKRLSKLNMKIGVALDFTENGIEIAADMNVKN